MIHKFRRVRKMAAITALLLTTTGCSVFISTPKVARIQIQRLDNKLIEYVVNLEDPTESNLGIRLSNRYTLQLDFDWLWPSDEPPETSSGMDVDYDDPQLSPWMLCEYRF